MDNPFVESLEGVVAPSAAVEAVVPVIRAIHRSIKPNSWDVAGGTGSIVAILALDNNWRLVVQNDQDVRTAIQTLLTQLKPQDA